MRSYFDRAASLTLAIALAGTLPLPAAGADTSIPIGVNLELSGPASIFGTPQLRSVQMVVDDINAHGGIHGRSIDLKVLDNKSDPTQSLTNVKELIEQDHVAAVIGGGTSPTTMSLMKYIDSANVPLISDGASNAIVTPVEERHWVFKTPPSDSLFADSITQFLHQKNIDSVGFLSVNNAYGDSGLRQFTAAADRAGIKIVDAEKFEATDSDVSTQLTKIRDAKPAALVVWAINPGSAIVAKNAAQLALSQTIVFSGGAASNAFTELAGRAANGAVVTTGKELVASQLPHDDPQRTILERYIKDYTARYHSEPDTIAAYGFDAMKLLEQAMQNGGGSDPAKIRDSLEHIHGFVGLSGVYNLSATDHQGLALSDLVIAQVRNGTWQIAGGK